ncbi:hypothetical protein PUN28_019731 [Cardiocondyla obscurior]|uniref:Uncharacterized protein n=1 Tax=Cardiocondyla obscurior TaxID=286306 RepID=A0AAW2EA62_9HYME
MVHRTIMIKDIPKDIPQEEFCVQISNSNPGLKVAALERLKKRNRIKDELELININQSCTTFSHLSASHLTSHKKFCKNTVKCFTCSQDIHENSSVPCFLPVRCINCNGVYRNFDKHCPEVIKRKTISRIMAEEGTDFVSARRILENNLRNNSTNLYSDNFPALTSSMTQRSLRTKSSSNNGLHLNFSSNARSHSHAIQNSISSSSSPSNSNFNITDSHLDNINFSDSLCLRLKHYFSELYKGF